MSTQQLSSLGLCPRKVGHCLLLPLTNQQPHHISPTLHLQQFQSPLQDYPLTNTSSPAKPTLGGSDLCPLGFSGPRCANTRRLQKPPRPCQLCPGPGNCSGTHLGGLGREMLHWEGVKGAWRGTELDVEGLRLGGTSGGHPGHPPAPAGSPRAPSGPFGGLRSLPGTARAPAPSAGRNIPSKYSTSFSSCWKISSASALPKRMR